MKLHRETLPDCGIGFAVVRGWESWMIGIQIGSRMWAVEW